jgi:DNA-binding NarL/FixJ family response regulator
MNAVRVLIVTTSQAAGATLRALIAAQGFTVAGERRSLDQAADARDVDVLAVADGVAVTSAALAQIPPAGIVLIGGEPVAAARLLAAADRAWGVVPADADGSVVSAAVSAVAAGLSVAPSTLAGPLVEGLAAQHDLDETATTLPVEPLTPRERDVLEAMSQGMSNRAIAARLGISEHTVKFHLASIFGKLGVTTRTGAVRRGLRRGLISL